jgi:NADPH:quinone reductase-like Zn-dependent oxidoreductase
MKAVYLSERSGPEGLVFGDCPAPSPDEGEVLVEIRATAITPAEFSWLPTFKTRSGDPRTFPIILSHEFSGVVGTVAGGASGLRVGDEVYGINDWFANGAQAEYCVAPLRAIAPKPGTLDHTQAAVAPISALTAWQGLFDRCKLQPGERVLIHGGAGGVGLFAVQLAHWRGAHVMATASTGNLDFVRGLGADEVIDYKTTQFDKLARDIDVVFDAVGGETLERSWPVLKPGGRAVTIASQSATLTDPRAHGAFFIVEASQRQLTEMARLFDAGIIRAFVGAVFPLAQAREGYARAQRGGLRGKAVLQVNNGA